MLSDTGEGNSHNNCISEDENNMKHSHANPFSKSKFATYLQHSKCLHLVVFMCFDVQSWWSAEESVVLIRKTLFKEPA